MSHLVLCTLSVNSLESRPTNTLANFPINVSNFEAQLAAHPDRAKVDYLITGLRHGFRLGFHSDKVKLRSAKANCPSANDHSEVIDKYLSDEIQAGRVFEPTKTPPFPYLHISRFGVIPEKKTKQKKTSQIPGVLF